MGRRAKGEGHRWKEGKLFRWEITVAGRRIVRKARTQEELDRKIREVRTQLETNSLASPDARRVTFADTWRSWMESTVRPFHSPNTVLSYDAVWRNHLAPLQRVRLQDLRPHHIQRIVNGLRARGLSRQPEYVVEVAHRCLAFAVRQGWIAVNPANLVDKPKSLPPVMRILRPGQIEALIGEMERRFARNRFRFYPLLWFLMNTGVRISEGIGLRWSDLIAGEDGVVRIVMRHQLFMEKGVWCYREVKSHSVRPIALNADAVHATVLARTQIDRDRKRAREACLDNGLVFPNEEGGPTHRSAPYHAFVDLQREQGFTQTFSVHELRHTYLSFVARGVGNVRVVQAIAGHKSLRTTERYLHVLEEDVDRAMTQVALLELGSRSARPSG
jgi:site-specific recombinase XerD